MPVDQTTPAKAPRRNAERTAATRAKLIEATIQSLYVNGYAATTTTTISDLAHTSRGAMLHHFPSKIDLVLGVAEHVIDMQTEYYTKRLTAYKPGLERFLAMTELSWDAWSQPSGVAVIEIMVAARSDPTLGRKFRPLAQAHEQAQLIAMRKLGRRAGIHDEAALDRMVRLNLAAIRGLTIELMLSQDRRKATDTLSMLLEYKDWFTERARNLAQSSFADTDMAVSAPPPDRASKPVKPPSGS
jgi:AcrR family transcriptional regulator